MFILVLMPRLSIVLLEQDNTRKDTHSLTTNYFYKNIISTNFLIIRLFKENNLCTGYEYVLMAI